MVGVQCYGPGLTEVGVDEDTPLGAVHRGHGDGFISRVGPVEVVLQPVQSQSHRGLQRRIHQRHLLGGVTGLVDEGTAGERGRQQGEERGREDRGRQRRDAEGMRNTLRAGRICKASSAGSELLLQNRYEVEGG